MTTHGFRKGKFAKRPSRTYVTWHSVLLRCRNPNDGGYRFYGAKGITVCERWLKFENFLADMGERPEGHTIDRIDPCGNYEPSNCRWLTASENSARTRRCRWIEHNGVTKKLTEWARLHGVPFGTLANRLTLGWPMERALTAPVRPWGKG